MDRRTRTRGAEDPDGGAPVNVLIVDDHPMIREGLRAVIQTPGIVVAGDASDGLEAVERARDLVPDVVVMDVHMPRMDGLEATKAIKDEFPGTAVLMFTTY